MLHTQPVSERKEIHSIQTHGAYRPDIDGLRAIAVLAVVLFHVDELWVRAGFIGVDIFFTISGFLISGIVLRSLHKKEFSLATFYRNRIRRIVPVLSVVILATRVARITTERTGTIRRIRFR